MTKLSGHSLPLPHLLDVMVKQGQNNHNKQSHLGILKMRYLLFVI